MAITIHLNSNQEKQLRRIAAHQGTDVPELVHEVLEDYLALQQWQKDSPEDWAQASLALAPEIMEKENWEEEAPNGSE